jgi:hypothetical protein
MDEATKQHVNFCKQVRSKGLIEHNTILGAKRVQFFTGKSFMLFLFKNHDKFKNPPSEINSMEAIEAYGTRLLKKGMLIRVQALP